VDKAIEIRLHGRGGQGTVTFAALLVDAAFRSGWHAVGFPAFGTERTGAPVAAFVRLSRKPIRDRSEVRRPSVVVIQDPTLVGAVDVTEGLLPRGSLLVNATEIPGDLAGAGRVMAVPATELAVEHLGAAITSTAMLGFLAGATGLVSVEAVVDAIRDRFRDQVARRNEDLARAAFAHAIRAREAA
jgi:pyruvate ferredoxin oxidoreductase gamma subunit